MTKKDHPNPESESGKNNKGKNQEKEAPDHSDKVAEGDTDDPTVSAGRNAPGPFDLESLRLSQDFTKSFGVKKRIVKIPVTKPRQTWWVRADPREDYSLDTLILELREERENYLLSRDLWDELADEPTIRPARLTAAVFRPTLEPFLWVSRLPAEDGRTCGWHETMLQALEHAKTTWIRVVANMNLGAYDIREADGPFSSPDWSSLPPFQEMLKVAFGTQYISNLDHPVLKRLRGEE